MPVARELIEDGGVDIADVLARAAGNSIGTALNAALTTGSGSDQPNGIMTAAGTGVNGTVTGGFTADEIIDLVYSVDPLVRRLPGTGFLMAPSAIKTARKLKDANDQYIFQPALSASTPDSLLGFPVFENPSASAVGSAAASFGFGYLPSYKVRLAGGLRVDRSDDYKFANDLSVFRFMVRVDGDLSHQSHFKIYKGTAA